MYTPPDSLIDSLLSPNFRPTDVLSFIQGQFSATLENSQSSPSESLRNVVITEDEFFSEEDIPYYHSVINQWPADLPAQHSAPTVIQLVFNYWIGPSFRQRLDMRRDSMLAWQASQVEEKKPKKAARVASKAGQAEYAAYLAICQERKVAMAEWSERVEEARLAWVNAKG